DLVSTQKGGVQNLGQLVLAVQNAFPRISGTFTLSAATTTVVAQAQIGASGFPLLVATNTSAALLLRTQGLYLSAVTSGTSFSVATQTGVAAGTETFKYIVFNPS